MVHVKPRRIVNVPVYNGTMFVSVAVFDVHATLVSILHNKVLTRMKYGGEVVFKGYL